MLERIVSLGSNPVFWKVAIFVAAYFIFCSAVSALRMPRPGDSEFYRWAFFFLQHLAANWKRAMVALKVPGAAEAGQAEP